MSKIHFYPTTASSKLELKPEDKFLNMVDGHHTFSRSRWENFSRTLVLDMLYRAMDEQIISATDLEDAYALLVNRSLHRRCVSVTPPQSNQSEPILQRTPVPAGRHKKPKKRYKGFVKCFGQREGYGFITCNELKEVYKQDVFLHHVQVSELGYTLTRGDLVEFTVEENSNKQPQARNLKRLRSASIA